MQFLMTLLLTFQNACTWGTPVEAGVLPAAVNESSGMAISRRIPNRSYRINDSGDSGRFYVVDLGGGNLKIVNISGFSPSDVEDMAMGPCGDGRDCIFIGDIGDNARRRASLDLVIVREAAEFPAAVSAAYRVRVKYPDSFHDAESLAVHPDGNVYITTKDAMRSQIFRLKRDQWRNPSAPVETMELVAVLDWTVLLPNTLGLSRLATSMDIAPDGKRFIVLTYTEAVEFYFDLSGPIPDSSAWKSGQHYRRVPLTALEQQEAIAYLPDGKSFLYDTERPAASRPARIFKVECRN